MKNKRVIKLAQTSKLLIQENRVFILYAGLETVWVKALFSKKYSNNFKRGKKYSKI